MDDFREIPIETPGVGHNRPPADPLELLRANLAAATAPLEARAGELLEAEERVPSALDAATVGRAADFVKQIGAAIRTAEERRKSAKQPYLDAGKVVDAAFAAIATPLAGLKARIERKIGDYQRAVEAEERRKREEEARRAQEEAARKEAEAKTSDALDEAIEAHAAAARAQEAAAAAPQEIARVRGEFGSVASTRTRWTYEIVDAAAIPRAYLMLNDAAIKAAIDGGTREIAGVRVFREVKYGQVR